jgi:hypothetical protein
LLQLTVDDFPIIKCLGDTVEEDVEERCGDCTVTRLPHATAVVATKHADEHGQPPAAGRRSTTSSPASAS